MDVSVIYDTDDLYLIIRYQQLSVFQLITIRRKSAVPLTLLGFLLPACHGLGTDVFTLYLGNG